MYRVLAAVVGAALLTGASLIVPGSITPASAYCVACHKARPDRVEVSTRSINHTRVLNRYHVVPRTRVVNDNRLILHKTILRDRYNTIVHNHVHYQDTIVHRLNIGHRYVTERYPVYATRQYTTVSHSTRVRYERGTICNCGERYAGARRWHAGYVTAYRGHHHRARWY